MISSSQIELVELEGAPVSASMISCATSPGMRSEPAPLSFVQERRWFLDQMKPNSPPNISRAVRIIGKLDMELLQAALDAIVARHEILRTAIGELNGETVQIINESCTVGLSLFDLTVNHESARAAKMEAVLNEDSWQPFDLSKDLVLRATLLLMGHHDQVLIVTVHRSAFDASSFKIFLDEFAMLYSGFSDSTASPPPDLAFQYSDFARWERSAEKAALFENQVSYWRTKLHDPPATELPTDQPRPPIQTFAGQRLSMECANHLFSGLTTLCEREEISLRTVLLTALNVLIHFYTRSDDIVIGESYDSRTPEVDRLIGCFTSFTVLRCQLDDETTALALLHQMKDVLAAADAHRDVPFAKVVADLKPQRDLSRNPLFQIAFSNDSPTETVELPDLKLIPLEVKSKTADFELSLHAQVTAEGLTTTWEYNTDLFDQGTICRIMNHYRTLLENLVASPDTKLKDLTYVTVEERHQLLKEWNHTQADYPSDLCIHELFEAQVVRTPDAVALIFDRDRISYGELNRRANQLARYLRGLGAGPESVIGICVERSVEMIVSVLAVLKAGGAYVPLDPIYPKERLILMLNDSQASVLITQQRLVAGLAEHQAQVVCVDTDWPRITQESEENLASLTVPTNLAYVIYTSGSTGRPKGVAIEHRNTVAFMSWATSVFKPEQLKGVLASTSICFDLSIFEMFVPLSCGGSIILVENVLELPAAFAAGEATLINTVPSAMTELLRIKGVPASVRTVNLAGEPLTTSLVRQIYQLDSVKEVFDLYGPTEDTTYSTFTRRLGDSPATIGRPISNTQAYILDKYLQPVPAGVPGELYLGGAGLARGYLNRPDLTAERFLRNPFTTNPDARIYKTGDLARYLRSGEIEYLGRIDSQVKIRGFRIELGEIEAVLSQYPTVSESVVIAREDRPGDKRLVAYVVLNQEPEGSVSELRTYLEEKLPAYMRPYAYIKLDRLPLTPNGKIDRKLLPLPEADSEQEKRHVTPRTAVEELLAGIWCLVLGLNQVGIDDDFFSLGGHSLLATQVISRIRQTFDVELPVRAFFGCPTVAGLGRWIETARHGNQRINEAPLVAVSRESRLPLSFAQQRLWFLDQLEPGSAAYNLSQAIRMKGTLNVRALKQSLDRLVARHESFRTTFETAAGLPVLVIAPAVEVPLPIADLSKLVESERQTRARQLMTEEAQLSFDLSRGPLFRVSLLRLGTDEHVLLLTTHHIISDGWSLGVFLGELSALYRGASGGNSCSLPELSIQYADFAVWQRGLLQGNVLEKQLQFWREQLHGAPALLELAADNPRPAIQSHRGAHYPIAFSSKLLKALKELSRREGTTLYMTLLAAFKTLLFRHSNQVDIVVGSPIANRNRTEIERLIGLFANTLALRTDLSGDPTFRELLARVREVTLGAYDHQDMPFEKLVEDLQPERSLRYNPIFQVLFSLHNTPAEESGLSDLVLTPIEVETGTSMFDLTVGVQESTEGISGNVEYNTDLFEASSISRLMDRFETLLRSIVTDPEERISRLTLLPETERYQLLVENNKTQTDYPQDKCLQRLFEEQVDRTPDSIALIFAADRLTYRELNARANQLAHYLRSLGVRPEALVGICVERSVEMIVGILGILKAGGAYVPLDPAFPTERLAFMLEDADVQVLLTQQNLIAALPPHSAKIVALDTDWNLISAQSDNNPGNGATAENLAYVIYTSGSTGRPKGVQIGHRALTNFLSSVKRQPGIEPNDVLLSVTTLSFDIAALEIYLPLITGAQLVIVSREVASDGLQLKERMAHSGVTIMQATPATWRMLIDAGWEGGRQLKVLCGGESLSQELADNLLSRGVALWNMYGPTETTIWSTVSKLELADTRISIGRPIGNTQVYLLDQNLEPVPVGVVGELHIGGAGLARGYLNRPELTAERFIANPFSTEWQAKIYKTGDLARYLPSGEIECLGRIDNQVKIRGFRIELGEIEAVISQHPYVRECVVIAREDRPGDKRLVAYVVSDALPGKGKSELRGFLEQQLPTYMVPSTFVEVDRLPLTPNGKIDRNALPVPVQAERRGEDSFVAPRNEIESKLVLIWEAVLGTKPIGVRDNFFEIGGNSLLAARMFSEMDRTLGKNLPLATLFQGASIEQLAALLQQNEDSKAKAAWSSLVPIQARGSKPPFFCVHGVGGNVLTYHALSRYLGSDQPFYGLQSVGLDGNQAPFDRVEEMAAHYLEVLSAFQPEGPYFLGGLSFGGIVAFEMARQLQSQGRKVGCLVLFDVATKITSRDYELTKRFDLHVDNLVRNGFTGSLNYLGKLAKSGKRKLKNRIWEIGYKWHRSRDAEDQLPQAFRKIKQVNYQAAREYQLQPYSGKVALFRANNRSALDRDDDLLGWDRFTSGVDFYRVPGDHLSILDEPHVRVLAGELERCLSRAMFATELVESV